MKIRCMMLGLEDARAIMPSAWTYNDVAWSMTPWDGAKPLVEFTMCLVGLVARIGWRAGWIRCLDSMCCFGVVPVCVPGAGEQMLSHRKAVMTLPARPHSHNNNELPHEGSLSTASSFAWHHGAGLGTKFHFGILPRPRTRTKSKPN